MTHNHPTGCDPFNDPFCTGTDQYYVNYSAMTQTRDFAVQGAESRYTCKGKPGGLHCEDNGIFYFVKRETLADQVEFGASFFNLGTTSLAGKVEKTEANVDTTGASMHQYIGGGCGESESSKLINSTIRTIDLKTRHGGYDASNEYCDQQ